MKIIIVGDLHIPNNKTSFINSDSFNEIFNTFKLIKDTVRETKAEYVIFLGDIFDVPHVITTAAASIISELLTTLTVDVPVILLAGNHDLLDDKENKLKFSDFTLSIKSSLLLPFKKYNNIVVFDTPAVATIADNLDIGFVPYSNNIIHSLESIKNKFNKGNRRLLLGHFDIQQVRYYQSSAKAFTSLDNVATSKDLIKKYKYDLCLLGHIHEPVEFNVDGKLIKFVGSCRNINFSNVGESKGIYVLDTTDLSLNYIENVHTSYFKTFRSIEALKVYCKNNEPVKLAKTKVKYVYSSITELKKVVRLKEFFKSLQFEKSMLFNIIATDKVDVNSDSLKEFAELIQSSTLTKQKLIDYSFQFDEPSSKDTALKVFNMLVR